MNIFNTITRWVLSRVTANDFSRLEDRAVFDLAGLAIQTLRNRPSAKQKLEWVIGFVLEHAPSADVVAMPAFKKHILTYVQSLSKDEKQFLRDAIREKDDTRIKLSDETVLELADHWPDRDTPHTRYARWAAIRKAHPEIEDGRVWHIDLRNPMAWYLVPE